MEVGGVEFTAGISGAIAYEAKGSALCCTISRCLSALSQNNWCQAYMVYMPILGHGCQRGAGQWRGELKASFTKCLQINVFSYSSLTSRAVR